MALSPLRGHFIVSPDRLLPLFAFPKRRQHKLQATAPRGLGLGCGHGIDITYTLAASASLEATW